MFITIYYLGTNRGNYTFYLVLISEIIFKGKFFHLETHF